MRHLAMTGMVTASWISWILSGSDIRATPPSRRMSAGTRSSAMTAHAPASSAIFASSASTTSMITPPLSISARPLLTRIVPVSCMSPMLAGELAPEHGRDGGERDLRLVEPRLARRHPLQEQARQQDEPLQATGRALDEPPELHRDRERQRQDDDGRVERGRQRPEAL